MICSGREHGGGEGSSVTRSIWVCALLLSATVSCTKMRAQKSQYEISSASWHQQVALGKELYSQKCSTCHGALDATSKEGRTPNQIKSAIGAVPNMAWLQSLPKDQIDAISAALGGLWTTEICSTQGNPGHVKPHRLNKDEYNRSVRRIFGINTTAGESLPEENTAFGFHNIAAILSVTPTSVDRYLEAAELAVTDAFTNASATIFNCNGQSVAPASVSRPCAEQILQRFGEQAFRRPITAAERTQLSNLLTAAVTEGLNLGEGVRWGLEWILTTPSFLYRIIEPGPGAQRPLTGYELATRLSYFLWSAPPDQELLARAADGSLTETAMLESQVNRMLTNPQAQALVDNFARQWLQLHRFEMASFDPAVYSLPEVLRQDMKTETDLLLKDVFQNGGSILRLVNDNSSYLNRRLATHYGVTGPTSDTVFEKTSLANTERRGLIGQGSVLALTSLPTRTSVVRRGKWILDNILCEPPAAPPPDVADGLPGNPGGSLKDQMAAHRNKPTCASCHNIIDPLGFALENFDANGAWRTTYRDGSAIDANGTLPDGRPVRGPLDLSKILEADPRYRLCVTQKLMTYALGRAIQAEDQCTINRLARDNTGVSKPFSDLVKGVVTSDPFRKQSGGQ